METTRANLLSPAMLLLIFMVLSVYGAVEKFQFEVPNERGAAPKVDLEVDVAGKVVTMKGTKSTIIRDYQTNWVAAVVTGSNDCMLTKRMKKRPSSKAVGSGRHLHKRRAAEVDPGYGGGGGDGDGGASQLIRLDPGDRGGGGGGGPPSEAKDEVAESLDNLRKYAREASAKHLRAQSTVEKEKSVLVAAGVQRDEKEMGKKVTDFCGNRRLVVSAMKDDVDGMKKLVKLNGTNTDRRPSHPQNHGEGPLHLTGPHSWGWCCWSWVRVCYPYHRYCCKYSTSTWWWRRRRRCVRYCWHYHCFWHLWLQCPWWIWLG